MWRSYDQSATPADRAGRFVASPMQRADESRPPGDEPGGPHTACMVLKVGQGLTQPPYTAAAGDRMDGCPPKHPWPAGDRRAFFHQLRYSYTAGARWSSGEGPDAPCPHRGGIACGR